MNIYAFIASIVGSIVSLAWPAALVIIVALFKNDLRKLLPLARLKYGESEISFRLDAAEKEAAALPDVPPVAEAAPTPEEADRFSKLVEISPSAAILEEARELEDAMIRRLQDVPNAPSSKHYSFASATRLLRSNNFIDKHMSALLDDLRSLRNAAAHGGSELTREDAIRFRELARRAKFYLNQW